jgi:hypothetical protein
MFYSNFIQRQFKVPGLFYWRRNINFVYISNWPCFSHTCDGTWNLQNPSHTKANSRKCTFIAQRIISPFFRNIATRRWMMDSWRFWTTVLSRKVRHQLPRDAMSCPRRTDTSKWIGIQNTLSSAWKVAVPKVSRVDYILINIFSNLRSYGQSAKLATRKITFPSASYLGDPRFMSRTGEGLCLTEQIVVFL